MHKHLAQRCCPMCASPAVGGLSSSYLLGSVKIDGDVGKGKREVEMGCKSTCSWPMWASTTDKISSRSITWKVAGVMLVKGGGG